MMHKIETLHKKSNPDLTGRTLNLEAIRSFVAICDTGSFRGAATRVHKSPSAVSLHINKLETLLGSRLLERDARHVTLTEQGRTLLGQARLLLGVNDETLSLFQNAPLSGHLCLAAPHDLGMSLVPGLLQRIAAVHPKVHIDVRLTTTDIVKAGLLDGTVNLALFNDVAPSTIPAIDLFSEPLKWLTLNGGRAAELDPLPLAVAEPGCAWRDAALNALQAINCPFRIAYSSDTSMGQVAAVRADLAIAALPQSLADRDLVEAPAHYNLPQLPLTHIRAADDGSALAKTIVGLIAQNIPRNTFFAAP